MFAHVRIDNVNKCPSAISSPKSRSLTTPLKPGLHSIFPFTYIVEVGGLQGQFSWTWHELFLLCDSLVITKRLVKVSSDSWNSVTWLPGNCCANPFSDEDSRAADPGQDTYRLLVLNPTPRDPSPSLTKPDTQDLVDGAMMTSDLVTLALAPLVQRSIPTNVFSCIQDMGEFWLASSGSVVSVHTYAEISPSWNVQMTTH